MRLCIHLTILCSSHKWLHNSEIHGSMLIYSSPWLIAVSHVLRRLLMPRHSPYALYSLNYLCLFSINFAFRLIYCLSFVFWKNCSSFVWKGCHSSWLPILHFESYLSTLMFFRSSWRIVVFFSTIFRKTILIFLKQFFSYICSLLFYPLFGFQWSFAQQSFHFVGRSGWTRTIDLALIRRAL